MKHSYILVIVLIASFSQTFTQDELTHTINRHNDLIGTAHYVSDRDLTLSENESQVMKIPLSKLEIDTNEYIYL